jgi:DNA-binding protein H-NS
MKRTELQQMPLDDLWALHTRISDELATRLIAEKQTLEERLRRLTSKSLEAEARTVERRPYPAVFPKFQNPAEPFQTWAGRGKQPRWLTQQLKSGRRIDDFRIQQAAQ